MKVLNTFSVIQAELHYIFMTRYIARKMSCTFWSAMSRVQRMLQMAMRGQPENRVSSWSLQGPGVTNTVTGIATAYMDSIPMVVISGQVPSSVIGQDAFQEVDAVGVTRPCVKHNFSGERYHQSLRKRLKKHSILPPRASRGQWLWIFPKDM